MIEEVNNDTKYLFRKAIDMWGVHNQLITINEEQNELTIELCSCLEENLRENEKPKNRNLEKIVEEMADVLLTLNYGEIIFDCSTKVKEILNQKHKIRLNSQNNFYFIRMTEIFNKTIKNMNILSKRIHDYVRDRHSTDGIATNIVKVKIWMEKLAKFLKIADLVKEKYEGNIIKLKEKIEREIILNKNNYRI